MTADRFFFPAVLAACAALAVLSAAEPARVAKGRADAQIAAAPVVQLERVTITVGRPDTERQLASAAGDGAATTLR